MSTILKSYISIFWAPEPHEALLPLHCGSVLKKDKLFFDLKYL